MSNLAEIRKHLVTVATKQDAQRLAQRRQHLLIASGAVLSNRKTKSNAKSKVKIDNTYSPAKVVSKSKLSDQITTRSDNLSDKPSKVQKKFKSGYVLIDQVTRANNFRLVYSVNGQKKVKTFLYKTYLSKAAAKVAMDEFIGTMYE